jgi:diguanylate cyclase (GGDEF)-like protein
MMSLIERLRKEVVLAGKPTGDLGWALVKEQYKALRTQVPIIYLLAGAALSGLQFSIEGDLSFGFNPPSALAACALVRLYQWLKTPPAEVTPEYMWRRIRQTTWLTLVLCLAICAWCLASAERNPEPLMAILLFGGLTAIGASFGLSSHPPAARIPLIVVALPLAVAAFFSDDAQFVTAAISLAVVSLLLLRVIGSDNNHLESLVASRAAIELEQSRTSEALGGASRAASTDYLTKLPNRRAFVAHLATRLEVAAEGRGFCLALIDLDKFKLVNDSFGHSAGDDLLQVVAARLASAVSDKACLARLGGDEFAVIFPEADTPLEAQRLGSEVLRTLNGPVDRSDYRFMISACCGLTIINTERAETTSTALKQADIALYHAKTEGAGCLALFNAGMEVPRKRQSALGKALQVPAAFSDIKLAFQPIVDLKSERIVAVEALARWAHKDLGNISPGEFIPVAEQLNLIGSLSEHLLKQAVNAALKWRPEVKLAFNLSAVQLRDKACSRSVLQALEESDFDPRRFQVEVTETAFLADFAVGGRNLEDLRCAGIQVILDDFGAGYSSISYLRKIRFDLIKLDGSLIASAEDTTERRLLLGAVIRFCQTMRIPCIAEHIETEGQLQLLRKLGCDFGQGFLLGQPSPEDEWDHALAGCRSTIGSLANP